MPNNLINFFFNTTLKSHAVIPFMLKLEVPVVIKESYKPSDYRIFKITSKAQLTG